MSKDNRTTPSYSKKASLGKCSQNNHYLSFVLTRCHCLSVVVTSQNDHYLPFILTRCHCLPLSFVELVTTRYNIRLSFYNDPFK